MGLSWGEWVCFSLAAVFWIILSIAGVSAIFLGIAVIRVVGVEWLAVALYMCVLEDAHDLLDAGYTRVVAAADLNYSVCALRAAAREDLDACSGQGRKLLDC